MTALTIRKNVFRENLVGSETNVSEGLMKSMPTISRNIQDFARLVPQAKVYSDGGMSFAGQNNKFNAFYIDGANSMDLLGVSSSGISGGQTSSPPVSVDALEEIRIFISPFDVQYGNFTGNLEVLHGTISGTRIWQEDRLLKTRQQVNERSRPLSSIIRPEYGSVGLSLSISFSILPQPNSSKKSNPNHLTRLSIKAVLPKCSWTP
jgi:hypothetical protein